MNTLREINLSKYSIKADDQCLYLADKDGNVIIKLMWDDIKAVARFIMRGLKEEKKN